MADKAHMKWLSEGVDAWNRRRREAPFTPDFSGADLSGKSLWRFNFRGANFRRADLNGATLKEADLEGADFAQANLYRADLSGAKPERASFHRATCKRTDFRRCDMRGARLDGADLTNARLEGANLRGADIRAWIAPNLDAPRNAFEEKFRIEMGLSTPIVTVSVQQLAAADGDETTLLPEALDRPTHWATSVEDDGKPELRLRATPAAEFDWREDGRLGATRLKPIPPRSQSGVDNHPLDLYARDQQLATVGRLAERIAKSLDNYSDDGASSMGNISAIARSASLPLTMIAEECAKPADEVLIAFVRANIQALKRLQGEDAEALADVDRVLLDQLLQEWERLTPFFPVLAEIDSPRNPEVAPEGSEAVADEIVEKVMNTISSDQAKELLSEETRQVFEAEKGKNIPIGADAKKARLVRLAALTAALKHALDDAPKPVQRASAFVGFAATVKEVVDMVVWVFL